MGYIYITTNLIDGKQYVGASTKKKNDPSYLGSSQLLLRDIRKQGRNSFSKEVLEYCETGFELVQKEKEYIVEHQTLYPLGYNKNMGGGICAHVDNLKELSKTKRYNSDGTWTQFEKDRVRLVKRRNKIIQ